MRHSGKIGDAVYGMTTAAAFGKTNFYLKKSPLFTDAAIKALLPLLNQQPYIEEARQWEGERIDLDLDTFRMAGDNLKYTPLSIVTAAAWNCYWNLADPWIFDVPPKYVNDIIINQTLTYYGLIDYRKIINRFKSHITFLGTEEEHEKFCKDYIKIKYYKTKDMLEAASVIKGSKIFIGGQSSPFAIAEGMKHPRLQSTSTDVPNCFPIGKDGYSDWSKYTDEIEIINKYMEKTNE